MIMWNCAATENGLRLEADAREHVARVVFPQVAEIVAKWNGKQGNKRFINALESVPGVWAKYFELRPLRVEIYYYGRAWYDDDAKAAPVPFFGRELPVCFVELDGNGKTDRVNAESLLSWCSSFERDALELRKAADGESAEIQAYNDALQAFTAAYEALPSVISHCFDVNNPQWRNKPITIER